MKARVGIIMGSSSDWETMQAAADTLESLSIAHEVRVISAHRTPDLLFEYAASARERGLKAIIAGAGGAAHLPGMAAANSAALRAPAAPMAKVATGIPLGICAIESSESRPPSVFVCTGTPSTGTLVLAAVIPGR